MRLFDNWKVPTRGTSGRLFPEDYSQCTLSHYSQSSTFGRLLQCYLLQKCERGQEDYWLKTISSAVDTFAYSQKGTLGRLFAVYPFTDPSKGCFRKTVCWSLFAVYILSRCSQKGYFRESVCCVCTLLHYCQLGTVWRLFTCSVPFCTPLKGYFRKTVCSVPFFRSW